MKNIIFAVIMAIGILVMCLTIAQSIITIKQPNQLINAYYPFSVETSILDR